MTKIDPVTLTNLRSSIIILRHHIQKTNALNYLKFRYRLERDQAAGVDNSEFIEALDEIADKDGDFTLGDVVCIFKKARNKKR